MESSDRTIIIKNSLKKRISYDEVTFIDYEKYESVLDRLLEDSNFIGLSLRYPYDDTKEELPNKAKYNNWQIRCAEELYTTLKQGGVNLVSYSENGISWTRDSNTISKTLTSEIIPKIGIPKTEEDDINE